METSYHFKPATEPWEFEAIERLNHETFAREIPQHALRADGRIRDRFHDENQYLVALQDQALVGMLAVRDRRPFSLDEKVPNLNQHLPPHRSVCEIRLLAVTPEHRRPGVFHGLMALTARECLRQGHDLAVISGSLRQLKLYRHMGFEAFGPQVGTAQAPYQPMFLRTDTFLSRYADLAEPLNFLPGPVPISAAVQKALTQPARYHRGPEFRQSFEATRAQLKALAGAQHVQVLLGSGTLANEAVAAQLSLLDGPGLVISNGEFGERLLEQARRWNLNHRALQTTWGEPLHLDVAARAMGQAPQVRWVWAVHGETSTGILNPLEALKSLCRAQGADLALDCVSTLGGLPVDLCGVRLASATSGKALASFPGLAIVFHDRPLEPSERLPRYLDLGTWDQCEGTPFTHSSNLVGALSEALHRFEQHKPFEALARQAQELRQYCLSLGMPVLAPAEHAHPCAITLALPPSLSAQTFGEAALARNIQLGWQSGYLRTRNWIQICLMVPHPGEDFAALQRVLKEVWKELAH